MPTFHPTLDWRSGYTLLEVLLALAILSATTAIVLPSMSAGLRSAANHAARIELEQKINSLRRSAVEGDAATTIGSNDADPSGDVFSEALPSGWRYTTQSPITFFPDGSCTAGQVTLTRPNAAEMRFSLAQSECRIQFESNAG